MQTVICLGLIAVLSIHSTGAADDGEQRLQDLARKLDSRARYDRQEAALALAKADAPAALSAFKRVFPELSVEAKRLFQDRVLPQLEPHRAHEILLGQLRAGLKTQQKVEELSRREAQGADRYEIEMMYDVLRDDDQWWNWVVRAERLDYVPTYDELLQMTLTFSAAHSVNVFADALWRRDPNRARADFSAWLLDPDLSIKRRGIWAFRGAGTMPSVEVTGALLKTEAADIEKESAQLVYILGRAHLDVLLRAVSHPLAQIRAMAEYRLASLGHVMREETAAITAGAGSPDERGKAWEKWWADHRNDSDTALRDRAVGILVGKSTTALRRELLDDVGKYRDHPHVYPILRLAASSSDEGLRRAALGQLGTMAAQGHTGAAETLVGCCQQAAPEALAGLASFVARIDDDRLGPLFLKAVKAETAGNTGWKHQVAWAIGEGGRAWAIEPLMYLVVEEGSGRAAEMLTHVEGADRVTPRLVESLLKQGDRNRRHIIRSAIEAAGGEKLAQHLTAVLPRAQKGARFDGGLRYDILGLMELWPDPNAIPLLRPLLDSDNPWDQLGAARVLGKLGDRSGAGRLADHLMHPSTEIAYHYFGHDIGEALRVIGAPDTAKRLKSLYGRGGLRTKELALHAMAQQRDPTYLQFMERQAHDQNSGIREAAKREMGALIAMCRQDLRESEKVLSESDLAPLRDMFLWAFFDQKILADDPSFPAHQGLKSLQGAVAVANRWQQVEFTASDQAIKLIRASAGKPATTSGGILAGRNSPFAEGHIERATLGQYAAFFLHLNYGGASYLFKKQGGTWRPIGYAGGVVE
jgi:hypothetical protein